MIVKSKITEDALQAHGQRYVTEVHTDHLGREHSVSYATAGDSDLDQIMKDRVAGINQQLVEQEIQKICDSGTITTPEFATVEQIKERMTARIAEVENEITILTLEKTTFEAEVK